MKIRVRFEKTGALRYIGHLDVMRYFQKLNRRAAIPVKYSEGFSPHQILSFSPPLSLGAISYGEYADMELNGDIKSAAAIKSLNDNSVSEIKILSFKKLPDKALNAMAAVTAARYECSLKESREYPGDINADIIKLLEKDEIFVTKKSKKNESLVDIKPLIYSYNVKQEDNNKIEFLLSAGSVANLKPELIYKALFSEKGIEMEDNFLDIARIDLYTGNKESLISLDDIGEDII